MTHAIHLRDDSGCHGCCKSFRHLDADLPIGDRVTEISTASATDRFRDKLPSKVKRRDSAHLGERLHPPLLHVMNK